MRHGKPYHAVARVVATTFALVKGDLKLMTGALLYWLAFLGTAIFTACYIFAIWWCGNAGRRLSPEQPDVWCQATAGQMFAVGLFTLVLVLALYGHWRDEKNAAHRVPGHSVDSAS